MAVEAGSVGLQLLVLLLLAAGGLGTDEGPSQQTQQKEDAVRRAVALRDKPGATAREQKQAISLLREATGLVSSSSSHAGVGEPGSRAPTLQLPGFDLAYAANGSASALRELAKSHQRGVGVEVNHKLSLELFRAASQAGDPEAQGGLAWRMAVGLHHPYAFEGASIRQFGPPDEAEALLHYYFGAAGGDHFSQAALGYRHTYGIGVPKSCWTAVAYYKPVAEAVVQEALEGAKAAGGPLGSSSGRGLPQVERIRLNVHANQGIKADRHREVLQYYQYSADRGNTDAQTAVGTLLNIGTHGVARDHAAAAHYLTRAAGAGNAEAMAHLGHLYGAGLGVAQDTAAALKWFRKSAGKQSPLGLYGLGYMYLSGTGVEQDYEQAFKYFAAASEAGDRDAHFYLGAMYMHGLGMRRKSLNKAVMHFFQAANLGHVQAQYNVALMHLAGKGTPRSCKPALTNLKALAEKGPLAAALQAGHEAFFRGHHNQALLSYLQASELGIEVAQANAAWMLGRGFAHAGPRAATVATSLYRRSAEQGNAASLLALGDAYYYGSGVPQDWVRSAAIYYEAYKAGSHEAMFNLGHMHQYGAGVPRDHALAQRFYKMARHTNADAALPVALARAWLRVHRGWEWARHRLPRGAVRTLDRWLFELTAVPMGSAGGGGDSGGQAGGGGGGGLEGMPGSSGSSSSSASGLLAQLPAGSGGEAPAAAGAAPGAPEQQQQQHGAPPAAGLGDWLGRLLPLPHGGLLWQWDSLVWRLTEAAGLAGLSLTSLMQEYADLGETMLLVVLLGVLGLVLHIRQQRHAALQRRVLAELAQPAGAQQQLRAQQLATELGLPLHAGGQATAGGDGRAPAADGSSAGSGGGGGGGAGALGQGSSSAAGAAAAARAAASSNAGKQAPAAAASGEDGDGGEGTAGAQEEEQEQQPQEPPGRPEQPAAAGDSS